MCNTYSSVVLLIVDPAVNVMLSGQKSCLSSETTEECAGLFLEAELSL